MGGGSEDGMGGIDGDGIKKMLRDVCIMLHGQVDAKWFF